MDIFGPKVLRGFNLFVDGRGYAGKVEELELPKLTLKTEEFRAGGMDAPVELDMGMEKLECSFTFGDISTDIMKAFGLGHNQPVSLTFRGALGLGDANVVPVVVRAQGMMREQDLGTWKPGDKLQHKMSVALKYYSYEQDGETIHEIDIENMVRIIDGTDILAAARAAIGR
jgi:P2 family phage contractile tail tube protein